MKKIIAFFTVIVYLTFACGVMVNYHYCMDHYTSFQLYQPAHDGCPTCGMHTKKQGCCHDDVKIVKLRGDYQTSSASFSIENIQPAITTLSEFLISASFDKEIPFRIDHSPPLLSQQDAYLQNCVFRI